MKKTMNTFLFKLQENKHASGNSKVVKANTGETHTKAHEQIDR